MINKSFSSFLSRNRIPVWALTRGPRTSSLRCFLISLYAPPTSNLNSTWKLVLHSWIAPSITSTTAKVTTTAPETLTSETTPSRRIPSPSSTAANCYRQKVELNLVTGKLNYTPERGKKKKKQEAKLASCVGSFFFNCSFTPPNVNRWCLSNQNDLRWKQIQ